MHCIVPKMRSINIKFFTFSVIVFAAYLFISFTYFDEWFMNNGDSATSVKLPYVVVHIDLKGSPPRLEYLQFLLPMLKDNGVNGLMIEYEDMFPYEGQLVNLSAKNCYDRSQLKSFLTKAVQSGFEIIPLIQTFGHLEFALKLREFMHLREVPAYPDSICPRNVQSRVMINHMLKQVVDLHKSISPLKFIHVGCDEVYHMNKCKLCKIKGLSDETLFLEHIRFLSDCISELSPETTVLIWDDMIRKMDVLKWSEVEYFNNVEPVYWYYQTNFVINSIANYYKNFKHIWAASAFKGADGIVATIPNLKNRILNHFCWMKQLLSFKIDGEKKNVEFRGIIMTGWSRFSHMEHLCELLPVSIPSLIINLRLIKKFKSYIAVDDYTGPDDKLEAFYSKHLSEDDNNFSCKRSLDMKNFDMSSCNFDGDELYQILQQYIRLISRKNLKNIFDVVIYESATEYNSSKYMNLSQLAGRIRLCNDTLNSIHNAEAKMITALKKYYSDDVTNEYVTFKTYHVKKQLTRVLKTLQTYLYINPIWERRPVSSFAELKMN